MALGFHVDYFSSLDDIKGAQRGDALLVLATIMKNGGRFSAFDASDMRMARTLTYIEGASGWTKRREPDCDYPWVEVDLTDAGRAALA